MRRGLISRPAQPICIHSNATSRAQYGCDMDGCTAARLHARTRQTLGYVPGSRGGILEFYNSIGTTILHSIDLGRWPCPPPFCPFSFVLWFVAIATHPESSPHFPSVMGDLPLPPQSPRGQKSNPGFHDDERPTAQQSICDFSFVSHFSFYSGRESNV